MLPQKPVVYIVFAHEGFGPDMLFIGPNDLACSMGNGAKNHMECADVQEAIEVIRVAAEKAGKLSGIFCIDAEQSAARFAQGFQFINIGGDSQSTSCSYPFDMFLMHSLLSFLCSCRDLELE